jgi:hypothetical protein
MVLSKRLGADDAELEPIVLWQRVELSSMTWVYNSTLSWKKKT